MEALRSCRGVGLPRTDAGGVACGEAGRDEAVETRRATGEALIPFTAAAAFVRSIMRGLGGSVSKYASSESGRGFEVKTELR